MNASKTAQEYVSDNPSIRDSLGKGLVNYSKLSRLIIEETKLKEKDFDAVLVSLTRIERKLRKKKSFQKKIRDILKETKLEIKTKMIVTIVEKGVFYQNVAEFYKEVKKKSCIIHIVEGIDTITIITEQAFEDMIKRFFRNKIKKSTKDLVEIVLRSPDVLEDVPGVTGYLYSLFSDRGINIVETMSCWTDTFFVIEKKYLEKAIDALDF